MNFMFWSKDSNDAARDPEVGAWLGAVDPGRDDATYWMRFHRTVLGRARPELQRRRLEEEASVIELVSAWSRALVPAALAAAAAAGIFLAQPPEATSLEVPMFVEDVLSLGLGSPIPAVVLDTYDDDVEGILAASEIY